jgi:hypothetical protein
MHAYTVYLSISLFVSCKCILTCITCPMMYSLCSAVFAVLLYPLLSSVLVFSLLPPFIHKSFSVILYLSLSSCTILCLFLSSFSLSVLIIHLQSSPSSKQRMPMQNDKFCYACAISTYSICLDRAINPSLLSIIPLLIDFIHKCC